MFKKLSIVGLVAVLAVMFFVLPGLAQEKEEAVIIYFFPGGNPGGVYAARVYNGAALAAEILGDRGGAPSA